ncbi:DUF2891 family protein [Saccharothrix carnea]|nr:DUF2891 family protein [Saccharothrix carnea]
MPDTPSDDDTAARLLSTAVRNVQRDYPAHWSHVVTGDADLVPLRTLHHRYTDLARTAAEAHRETGLRYVFGHGYYAEHWLGTFAAYLHFGAFTGR